MSSQIYILRLFLDDSSLTFLKLRTTGGAISAELANQTMADRAIRLAEANGWACTRNDNHRISIESGNPEPIDTSRVTEMFHVSVEANREAILRDGLQPSRGGSTSLNRFYGDRIHLALRRRDAFQFMNHQLTHPGRTEDGKPRPFLFEELDLFSIRHVEGSSFYNDDHFDGRGLWTSAAIKGDRISLVDRDEWHGLFRELYEELFNDDWMRAFCVTP